MPRGRFLSKSISLDEKVNALSDDTARLLFTWLISHLDCEGRLHGDALTVKSIVFPRRPMRTQKVEKYLVEFEKNGLIVRYSCNGNTYLVAPNFEKHQSGLQKSKEAQSQIPPFTPELLQSKSDLTPPQVKGKAKVEVKDIYGEFQNVLLSDKERGKLVDSFGEPGTVTRIEELSVGIASKGYKYKDHYATILSWDRKKKRDKGGQSGAHQGNPRQIRPRDSYTRPEDA